jgi:hypothetical protein
MKTRCKFRVESVTKFAGNWEQVKLTASYDKASPEDVSFSAATPTGDLNITVTNPAVIGTFTPGASYYLDLVPAE